MRWPHKFQVSAQHVGNAMGRHAGRQKGGRCRTRCESEDSLQERKCASDSTLVLKPKADVTRSPKHGYQWPHKKDMCPTKIKKIK